MKGERLPSDDHVLRHLPKYGHSNGKALPEGFALKRNRNEQELSVNWLEIISRELDAAYRKIRDTYPKKLNPSQRFGQLNVGAAVRAVAATLICEIQITHDPKSGNLEDAADYSHSGIFGLWPLSVHQELLVRSALARAVNRLLPAKELEE